jgi:hypothetical protein
MHGMVPDGSDSLPARPYRHAVLWLWQSTPAAQPNEREAVQQMNIFTTIVLGVASIAAFFGLDLAFGKIRAHCATKFRYRPHPITQFISMGSYILAAGLGVHVDGWHGSLLAIAAVIISWSLFFFKKTDIISGIALATFAPLFLVLICYIGEGPGAESLFERPEDVIEGTVEGKSTR